nr:putative nuclease [Diatraea saccharalis]
MGYLPYICLLVLSFRIAEFTEPPCVIDLQCTECMPDNMPMVASHRAVNGTVVVGSGDEALLSCGGGKFLAYPLWDTLAAVCEAGRYRLRHDHALRHLLDLGCQEDMLEDVLHQVPECAAPLQGRTYRVQERDGRMRHLATVCFDPDRGVPVRAQPRPLHLPPHSDARAPLTLLGNFNHMFDARTRHDAERLYSDDASLNRRLRELLRPARVTLGGHTLTAAGLLAPAYFDDQETRAADFASNKVAVWSSVAEGNLRHVQRDVARLRRRAPDLQVYAGTHAVLEARGAGQLRLRGGRFPVPRYVWTVAVRGGAGLALVVLNDPLVAVSEVRRAVFCDSLCGRARWLLDLHRNRNYEVPALGLVFCCSLQNFTALVPELPEALVRDVSLGEEGLLLDLPV